MSKASDYAFACEARKQKYPPPFKPRNISGYGPIFKVDDGAALGIFCGQETRYIPADEVADFIAWLRETFED